MLSRLKSYSKTVKVLNADLSDNLSANLGGIVQYILLVRVLCKIFSEGRCFSPPVTKSRDQIGLDIIILREDLPLKRIITFGHCPN